jgi:protein-tyrosine phosphatase
MKQKFVILTCFLLFGISENSWSKHVKLSPDEVVLTLNAPGIDLKTKTILPDQSLPRNWRKAQDPFQESRKDIESLPSRQGLDQLQISGSGEFSKGQFLKLAKNIPSEKFVILDLRQESHGLINNLAVSWYSNNDALNAANSLEEIEKDEAQRLSEQLKNKKTVLTKWLESEVPGKNDSQLETIQIPVPVSSVMTEKKFVNQLGYEYYRIPAPDYKRPRDQDVDRFVSFYKHLKGNKWVHFHCAAGQGRTTTFMTMFDMMKNSKNVSSKDIIRRQWMIGGVDLEKVDRAHPNRKLWAEERRSFILQFYKYASSEGPEFKKSWSEWLKNSK